MTIDTSDPTIAFFTERSHRKTLKRLKVPKGAVLVTPKLAKPARGNVYARTRTGFRPDLGVTARSSWEANVMRILQAFEIRFTYEPLVFHFPVVRGRTGYCPDLQLAATQEWIEVKGYFDDQSRIKLKRFSKYYPDEFSRMTLIIGKNKHSIEMCNKLQVPRMLFYEELVRLFRDQISTWEG